ncbi:MAG: ABC transporter permease [Verrucomicrobia bacterium]|nr:ABC transporter permease [Verrucomicrobiota bacterium]MBU4290738.1 ABC transporter permease [Verrucomicrobiota bacterium]MBU4428671.1 ABC transporter permease [Verrucomicrobiota bacterium]MCG2679756.1 ABC transporter permease [Kiritimatiellia bacterium]
MSVFADILDRRELLYNLVVRNLKSRYKDSVLGFLWSIITPLFMALIYLVFLRILARGIPMEEILIGVFAWQFTAQCVGNGLTTITDNSNLVKKVYFPRIILPLATTFSNLVTFLLSLVVQFALVAIILAFRGQHLSAAVLAVPLLIVYHTLFCLALTLFLSCLNVYFRDIEHLVNVLTTAWFFLSPAMYSMALVHDLAARYALPALSSLYMLNPMAIIITGYRALILPDASFPWSPSVLAAGALPILFLIAAYILFQKLQRSFSDFF